MNQPIKRHEGLKQLSREHHYGLLLCWKIKTGFQKNIEYSRISKYVLWFWEHHLSSHFENEELYIFPVLGNDHELITKAISEHRYIQQLATSTTDIPQSLNTLEKVLSDHIRFEERVLFNKIQSVATEEQWKEINAHHSESKFQDNLEDPFWL